MKPLAALYSTIDSAKRVLADRLADPVEDLKRTFGRAKEDTTKFRETQRAGGDKAMEAMLELVLNTAPAAKILMHGGANPIVRPNPNLIPNVDYQAVQGPGFYLSNKLGTPQTFAAMGHKSTKQKGHVSVFDLADDLYATTLKLSDRPISKQPEVAEAIFKLASKDEGARQAIIDYAKFMKQGSGKTADEVVTGNLIDKALRKYYGGMEPAYSKLAEVGVPGKTWQYRHDYPSELATLVFPQHYDKLTTVGTFPIGYGAQELKAGKLRLDNLLMDSEF